jgi:hypothetical protein
MLAGTFFLTGAPANAFQPSASVAARSAIGDSLVQQAKIKRWYGPGRVVVVRPWRPWRHRKHYGAIIAGVTLGTIIAVAAANAAPPPPSPDLCWYWSDRAHTHGYWDYCY